MKLGITNRRLLPLAGASAVLALALSGCSGSAAGGRASAEGPSVDFGASIDEWNAAFEEVDGSWELVWETASAAASSSGAHTQELADLMEERSGGKVTVEVAFQQAISGKPQDGDEALEDGRTDIHLLVPFQQPSDFPVTGQIFPELTIQRPGGYLSGYLAALGATNEVAWGLPEMHEEFEDRGLTVMAPMPTQPAASLACSKPVESLADLKGKQIRVGPAATYGQIEALGAVPVSVVFADLYESLQRGIVDCMVIGTSTMALIPGMTELAPYIYTPSGASFASTTGIDIVGSDYEEWPLPVRQLVYDTLAEYTLTTVSETFLHLTEQHKQAVAAGGGFFGLDDDVNEALAAYNKTVQDGWSSSPHLENGAAFSEELTASLEEWNDLMVEAGFSDADFSDYENWLKESPDWESFNEVYYERVHIPNRPS